MRLMSQEECRNVQMNILDDVAVICKEHNLQYYLAFGSLLGAVRHKGYIPWDDDIDICMIREDYEKFISIAKQGFGEKYKHLSLIDNTTDGYYNPFAKVVDNRTEVEMERHTAKHGLWLDIFPLDGVPSSPTKAKIHMTLCAFLRVVALATDANFSSAKINFTWLYKRIFNFLARAMGLKRFAKLHETVFKHFKAKDSDYIANLFTNNGTRSVMDKERLLKVALYTFENRQYEGYADYDYYLKRMYGDYMKLPPKEQQITHAFKAWWKE